MTQVQEILYQNPVFCGKLTLCIHITMLMDLVNNIHSFGYICESFFDLGDDDQSHGEAMPEFGDQRACLMLIAMGLHNVEKMGTTKASIFCAIDAWMFKVFSAQDIQYLPIDKII